MKYTFTLTITIDDEKGESTLSRIKKRKIRKKEKDDLLLGPKKPFNKDEHHKIEEYFCE